MLFLEKSIELNPMEEHIYKYINSNLNKIVTMKIRDLANETNVSTTTILRFCKRFGCSGYSDFRLKLQYYIDNYNIKNNPAKNYDITEFIDFVKKMNQSEYAHTLDSAIDLILESEFIFFVGTGTSAIMAQYGATLFSSLYAFSLAISDPQNLPIHFISNKLDGYVCSIVISVSGENTDVIDYIHRCRLHNIKILSITNSSNNTIANLSDINIPYYISEEYYHESNITSQLPVICLLEYITKQVHSKAGNGFYDE